jgi:hypothetical protein
MSMILVPELALLQDGIVSAVVDLNRTPAPVNSA